ncbi:MAG: hypothetical protein H7Z16_08235 [Pyrinomonadaceae bacterium]|nr:hypothetical protein [Pyrinomonadaceae bacterium]
MRNTSRGLTPIFADQNKSEPGAVATGLEVVYKVLLAKHSPGRYRSRF